MDKSMNRATLAALPILVAAQSKMVGVKVVIGGNQAKTNGEVIMLPNLPIDDPDTTKLALGYVAHESEHVRTTDFSVVEEIKENEHHRFNWSNVLEDIRIEHEAQTRLPGLKHTLANLVSVLVQRHNFDCDIESDSLLMDFVLVTFRFQYLGQKALEQQAEEFRKAVEAECGKEFADDLLTLCSEVKSTRSTREVLILTDKVLAFLNESLPPPPQDAGGAGDDDEADPEKGSDSAQGGPSQQADPSAGESEAESDDATEQDGSTPQSAASPDSGEVNTGGESQEADQDADPSGKPGKSASDQLPLQGDTQPQAQDANTGESQEGGSSMTAAGREMLEKAIDPAQAIHEDMIEKVKEILAEMSHEETAIAMAEAGAIHGGHGGAPISLEAVQASSTGLRSRIIRLLEAETQTDVRHVRRGHRFSTSRLHRLALGNPRVFTREIERPEMNTAIVILLDRSISMARGGKIEVARNAALSVALALQGVEGVATCVSSFPGLHDEEIWVNKAFDENARRVSAKFGVNAGGGTPMAEAMLGAVKMLVDRKEQRKMIMIVTDGEPNNPEGVAAVNRTLPAAGIEAMGLGIGVNLSHLFRAFAVIHRIEDLPSSLSSLVVETLKDRNSQRYAA